MMGSMMSLVLFTTNEPANQQANHHAFTSCGYGGVGET